MKLCVAFVPTPFDAVTVIENDPVCVGVPLRTPPALRVTPVGSAPVSLNVGAGKPVAVTVKELTVLIRNAALFALVMAGAWFTVSVKLCVAFGVTPLAAVIVIGYVPPIPAAGVPLRMPPALRVMPEGNAPVSLNVGAGNPVATTVNEPALPTVKVVLLPLVIAGA